MKPRFLLPVLLLCLVSSAPILAQAADEAFQKIPVFQHPDLDIVLIYHPTANPAQAEFIGFLTNNKTGKPLKNLPTGNWRIDNAQRFLRHNQQLASTGSLASGNDYDLFYRDRMVINTPRPPLPPGESRHLASASSYSFALLGIPPADSTGFTIKARIHMSLTYQNQSFTTPPDGLPIQFDWMPTDDTGIKTMQNRLRDLLINGDPGSRYHYALMTFLKHPPIASAISSEDLITGLYQWEQSADPILDYLDAHPDQQKGLAEYAMKLIEKRDHLRMLVLARSTSLHDTRLIEPLKKWALNTDSAGAEAALQLLSKQIHLAPDPAPIAAELGKAWLAKSPLTLAGKWEADKNWRWNYEMHLLGFTRDKNLIPLLVPYLDRREIAINARDISAINNGVSTRVCDVAYNTLLDILNRDDQRFSMQIGHFPDRNTPPEAAYTRRDELIKQLKQALNPPADRSRGDSQHGKSPALPSV